MFLSRPEAINWITERTLPKGENRRAWRNKIDGILKTRIARGEITLNGAKQLCFNDLARAMRRKYPGKFDDWPVTATHEYKAGGGVKIRPIGYPLHSS